jgi:methylenetetrahydrofolate reductase (NADPH)
VRIDAVLAQGTTTSFEFFPPKSDEESQVLTSTLAELEPLRPSSGPAASPRWPT